MRKLFTFFLALSFVLPVLMFQPARSSAQAGDAWQLIAEVNALRAAYGLPPYEVNNALMSAAQGHSNYQAQIGTWTHTGPGGSRPHDRAVAAGYGGGAQVFVSENVALGINLSTSRVVNEMWQDAIHLETMISSRYTQIGAGVGHAGDWEYYTIDVGYIAGSAGSGTNPDDPPPPSETDDNSTPAPTVIPVEPISIAIPGADGSIQHVVQWGQFLENIATAYGMELIDLLALNGLSDQAIIYPGDKLLIQAGSTPPPDDIRLGAPTREPEETNVPTATATSKPIPSTATPVPVAMSNSSQASPTDLIPPEMEESANDQSANVDYLLYAVFGLAISGTALIMFGTALKRRS
ncbi:MAG: CAP domain-containing protein [Anaerolineales bacterium]